MFRQQLSDLRPTEEAPVFRQRFIHYVYLIVICDPVTNAIRCAEIWSSPEWEQSRYLPDCHVFVAYRIGAGSFHEAKDKLEEDISNEKHRYHYLFDFLNKGRGSK